MPQTPTTQVDIDLYLHVRVLISIILVNHGFGRCSEQSCR